MTVSGFVVHEARVALHWHRKLGKWLPAGGHVEPGEDTLGAVLREVREEFALAAQVIGTAPRVEYDGGPRQLEPPYTVLEYWVEPDHCHVDYVYILRCAGGYPGSCHDPASPILWLDAEALARGSAAQDGVDHTIPADVQVLGLEAIRLASTTAASPVGT